jgi:hypothetical protein
MKIIANTFVKRQTPESSFSHYDGDFESVARLTKDNIFENRYEGYREGVVLVTVPPENFYSGIVQLESGDTLKGEFSPRRDGEEPRKHIVAHCRTRQDAFLETSGCVKLPAKSVQIVLYASTVLAEDGDNELPPQEGNWEIISINASPLPSEVPINPMTLMHNHFGSDGGTDTHLSDKDFVIMLREGFEFWKDKAMIEEQKGT